MELNNKEKKIKQVLSDLNYEVDTDFLWKEVSRELDDKKKKRRFFWIFPVVGIALLSYFLLENFSVVSKTDTLSKEISSITSTPSSIELEENKSTSLSTQASEVQTQIGEKNVVVNEIKIKENNTQTTTSKLTNNSSDTSLKPIDQSTINSNTILNSTDSKSGLATIKKATSQLVINSIQNISEKETRTEENPTGNSQQLTSTRLENIQVWPFVAIDRLALSTLQKEAVMKAPLVLVESTSSRKRFFVGAAIGTIRDISSVNTSSSENLDPLFEREQSLLGFNTTIQFGKETEKKFRIFGGLDYAHLVTRYYNGETEILADEEDADLPFINASNDLSTIEGSLTTSTTVKNDIQWHRHHEYINVQLGISKDLFPTKRFIVSPEVSLLQNIVSRHKGYYFNEQSPYFTTFEKGDTNPYRKNIGLQTQLGLNLGYETPQWQFAIITAWRNPISPITNGTNNYQIKNSQLSIQARVNYLLNWEKN